MTDNLAKIFPYILANNTEMFSGSTLLHTSINSLFLMVVIRPGKTRTSPVSESGNPSEKGKNSMWLWKTELKKTHQTPHLLYRVASYKMQNKVRRETSCSQHKKLRAVRRTALWNRMTFTDASAFKGWALSTCDSFISSSKLWYCETPVAAPQQWRSNGSMKT